MKRPKKRTKKYVPKFASTNPMRDFFAGQNGTYGGQFQRVMIHNHAALSEMTHGRGTRAHWETVAGALGMGKVLCEQGIGAEFLPTIVKAQGALDLVLARAARAGRYGFAGDELTQINEAFLCHDAQIENIRVLDIEQACDRALALGLVNNYKEK